MYYFQTVLFNEYPICVKADEHSVLSIDFCKAESENKNSVTELCCTQLAEYFSGNRREFSLPLKLTGTPFQQKVWRELCNIPYGEVRTYKQIAQAVGSENACRAVGGANHSNKLPIVIPCHRVIAAGNKLGGYGGGLELKKLLLKHEGVKTE